jgi:hypothetical protein
MAAHLGRRPNPFGASHLKKRPPTFEGEGRPSLIAKSRENSALPALVSRCEVNHHLMEIQAFLIAIFFSLFCASVVFGSVTVSTPFLKFASILSASTPSGTPNERWKEP